MRKIQEVDGIVMPLDRVNVDTDAIIPKQFLKSILRTGFGKNCFDEWRYLDPGIPGVAEEKRLINPDFIMNKPEYQQAKILLARDNFGCGSSREHACWALTDWGFEAIIAPSFAEIFRNNATKNALLLVVLSESVVETLFQQCFSQSDYQLKINLAQQTVTAPDKTSYPFQIDPAVKYSLQNGLDEIGRTLEFSQQIKSFEQKQKAASPWLYGDNNGE